MQELHRQQLHFFKGNPYSVRHRAKGNKHIYRIRIHKELPRHRLAALVGDCVHNLRSALDHLVWQLSEDFSGVDDSDTTSQFPIFRSEHLYQSRGVNQIGRVGASATALIRLLQPFHDEQPLAHPLWFVHDLDRRDKHLEASLTAVAAKNYGHRISHRREDRGTFHLLLSLEDIEDGVQIAEVTIFPKDAKVRVQPQFEFEIALTRPTVPDTTPRLFVVSFLDYLATRVSGVIKCFDPFYASGSYDDAIVLDDPIAPFHSAASPAPPPDRGDFHEEWAKQGRDKISEGANAILEALTPQIRELPEQSLRDALERSGLIGFLAGVAMVLERVDDARCEETTVPPDL